MRRPFLSINMAMSIDGKIATAKRGPVKLGSNYDSRRMAEIRAEHDLVINGAQTFRAHPFPLIVQGKDLLEQRKRHGLSSQPISAVVSSKLDIPRATPWEKAHGVERWAFCGNRASRARREDLEQAGVKVFVSKRMRPTPEEMMKAFRGLDRVLLEGGGELNASFLERGLVDRIYLTLVPILVGGAMSPTLFEGKGFSAHFPRFRLRECREVRGELYLVYER